MILTIECECGNKIKLCALSRKYIMKLDKVIDSGDVTEVKELQDDLAQVEPLTRVENLSVLE